MNGSFRLFRLAGITVYLHWTWLLVALFQVQSRGELRNYQKPIWNWIEYLSLFGIVLVHEFGHALACRQVGGFAERIILWPLGGVAFVNPPPRPAALLWSIAAGSLVNVLLVPVTGAVWFLSNQLNWPAVNPDLATFLETIFWINFALLVFNILPIYPLDGGQILQALLWFFVGRAESLMVVSVLGLVGSAGLLLLAFFLALAGGGFSFWLVIIVVFLGIQSVAGLGRARQLARFLRGPRHQDAACPSCGTSPLAGPFWRCEECGQAFDTFAHRARCPNCGQFYKVTRCPECYQQHPIDAWFAAPLAQHDSSYYAPH